MTERLKPCPFCNTEVHLEKAKWYTTNWIIAGEHDDECPFFFMEQSIAYESVKEATKSWNRRADEEGKGW